MRKPRPPLPEPRRTGSTAFAKRAFGKVAADRKTYGESPFVANPEPWIDGRRLQSDLSES
jgi:hypothetical protein